MKRLLAEVNISEGRNHHIIDEVLEALKKSDVEVIDVDSEPNHNRTVFTYIGEPEIVLQGTKDLAKMAVSLIDMSKHTGSHPRMGAVDVVPFIPVKEMTTEEAVQIAREFGRYMGKLGVPVYYYEDAATLPERVSLVNIRKGQYEALPEKMKQSAWQPDEGPFEFVPKSGATVTGVRFPLIAFNVNLKTDDFEVGKRIVKAVRGATGGYQNVRAIALYLEESNRVQISMNLVNYTQTPIHRVFETIKSEAASHGVLVEDTELVGPVPLEALQDVLAHYLQAHHFSMDQIYT
jgi:glutamate formiminotransferase / 5-formyltetrahydrofolate cyclo-ligase